jgi:hypothetical protein
VTVESGKSNSIVILVFAEDSGLELHPDCNDLWKHYESVDVLSDVYTFYDDQGRPLKPVFDIPVKKRRYLWFFETFSGGKYHLELDTSNTADPLWLALNECSYMEPSLGFRDLKQVKSFLRERGVVVEPPDSDKARIHTKPTGRP